MNWFHLHDLLGAQIERDFPDNDLHPFASEVRASLGNWEAFKPCLLEDHARNREAVETALLTFVHEGHWPEQLAARQKHWVSARLFHARKIVLFLCVPLGERKATLQPVGCTDAEVLEWLLFIQWEATGLLAWLAEVQQAWTQGVSSSRGGLPPGSTDAADGVGFGA